MPTLRPRHAVTTSIDKVPVIAMNAEQIAELHEQIETARIMKLPQLHDATNPHSRLYVLTLDGTQNDAINDPLNITNIGLIDNKIQNSYGNNGATKSRYEAGVGNQKFIGGLVDSIIGFGVSQQAQNAYVKFISQANKWYREDPDVKISLAGVGFSRGAAALIIASNMVHEKGIPDLSTRQTISVKHPATGEVHTEISYSRYIIPPGKVPQTLILNDQVATGKAADMDRRIASSVVSVVQLMALNENRAPFPFYSAEDPHQSDPRIHTLRFKAAHSDIGGGYKLNGISSVTLNINEIILNKYGANIPESTPETDPKKYVIHDSEYLWGNRDATSPTPPLETQDARKVIYDKGPCDGLQNPVADDTLQGEQALKKHLLQEIGLTQDQYALVMARIQENFSANSKLNSGLQIG